MNTSALIGMSGLAVSIGIAVLIVTLPRVKKVVAKRQRADEEKGIIRHYNGMALAGFTIGLVSYILFQIAVLSLLAIIFSALGLGTFKHDTQKGQWMAWVGLFLGVGSLLMFATVGHFK